MFNKCADSLLKLNLRIYDSLIRWKSVSTTVPSPKGEFTAKGPLVKIFIRAISFVDVA